jgi:hypothetical protein
MSKQQHEYEWDNEVTEKVIFYHKPEEKREPNKEDASVIAYFGEFMDWFIGGR